MTWKLAVVAGALLGALFGQTTDTPRAEAQGVRVDAVDAVEYGISLGLPRAWAYRVAWCESKYDPGAYNRSSGAAGLYQFTPRTWAWTPQGRAGMSPFDRYANAAAAAWLYHTAGGGPRHWSCR